MAPALHSTDTAHQVLIIYLLVCRTLFIPNCTFFVRFGGISGEFGRAKVRTLARPNEMPPKHTRKGTISIASKFGPVVMIS